MELLPKEIKSSLLNSAREKKKGSFKTSFASSDSGDRFQKKV